MTTSDRYKTGKLRAYSQGWDEPPLILLQPEVAITFLAGATGKWDKDHRAGLALGGAFASFPLLIGVSLNFEHPLGAHWLWVVTSSLMFFACFLFLFRNIFTTLQLPERAFEVTEAFKEEVEKEGKTLTGPQVAFLYEASSHWPEGETPEVVTRRLQALLSLLETSPEFPLDILPQEVLALEEVAAKSRKLWEEKKAVELLAQREGESFLDTFYKQEEEERQALAREWLSAQERLFPPSSRLPLESVKLPF